MKTNQNFYKWHTVPIMFFFAFACIYGVNAQTNWTGAVSTAWSNTLNWDNGVPTSSVDATIDPSNYLALHLNPTLDNTGLAAQSLTINGAAVLSGASSTNLTVSGIVTGTGTLTANASTITISGDMVISVFNAGTSTVILNGSGTQSIDAYTFHNLEVDNSSVVLSNPEIVNGNLTGSATLAGVTGGSLSIGGNMSVAGYTANTSTVTLDGSSVQTISEPYTLYNLTMNNSGGAILTGGNLTVTNNLVLTSGILTSDISDLLILSSTLPVSGASNSSFVDGPIRNTALDGVNNAFTFPTGNINKYAPIGLSNVSGTSQYTAQYFKSGHGASLPVGGATASTDEYWTLVENSNSASADVTLNWMDGAYSGITDVSEITIYYDDPGTWVDLGATGTASGSSSSGSVTASATGVQLAASPNFFTFGDNSGTNPLPVSLVSFTAQYQDNHVNLNWATASEQNNGYFEVQRSADASNWVAIAKVQGHGTTDVYNSYVDIDNLVGVVPSGNLYYRLKQVDFNGAFTYSMIRSVDMNNPAPTVSTYPNPANSTLNVNWTSNSDGNSILRLVNETGINVYDQTISGKGIMQRQIDLSDLPTGIYFVQLIDGTNKTTTTRSVMKN